MSSSMLSNLIKEIGGGGGGGGGKIAKNKAKHINIILNINPLNIWQSLNLQII